MKLKRYQQDPAAERWLLGMSQFLGAAFSSGDHATKAEHLRMVPAVDIALRPSPSL
jgi:hypothetical protein